MQISFRRLSHFFKIEVSVDVYPFYDILPLQALVERVRGQI